MDSLLANYASSDEEDEYQQQQQQQPIPSKTTSSSSSSSLFSILPQPKSSSSSSSLFNSLPPPKQQPSSDTPIDAPSNFTQISSLPKPKSQIHQQPPKRVVQFKPPIIPLPKPTQLEDEDDEEERNRRRKMESSIQTPSVKSFLSTIPAPRNSSTLGVQSSSGSGRRSILETSTPAPETSSGGGSASAAVESNVPVEQNTGDYENYQYATDQYDSYGNYQYSADQYDGSGASTGTASNSDGYASYGGAYEDYGQYGNNWVDRSGAATVVQPEPSGISESMLKFTGKRGRKDVPVEVIEVKQDELIKNRPREDQSKLTGLAFGPSYQPVSAKGKPSKLLKRKHQIGSLYFDMKQNEMKLAERRAKGMLTKAETQAKYGW
ncbi:putative proline-rich protein PRCC [Medicago truncatula]|uniref:Mitotic checkpoint protein prcc-carboxy-term protein n=1 Tax=Medicago truncatula TaxID=3880 RepID=G7JU99_MEDTR|nr:proline-rich protein PRCC [Medicago truncatula]AES92244.1 mitotic checkpoint protein prcc-carboxy-term protein [Medicago truncatula]AFK39495.1 unknown [Medicago truncatula]RHN64684.1 putative proline-rich protein PRCC [Medicago truncatula]